MKFHPVLRRSTQGVPLLESARLSGRPRKWPSEQLERLLTANEIDLVRRGQI